jgi:hypothetical protein
MLGVSYRLGYCDNQLSAVVAVWLHSFIRRVQKYSKRTVSKGISSVLRNHCQFPICVNVLIELGVAQFIQFIHFDYYNVPPLYINLQFIIHRKHSTCPLQTLYGEITDFIVRIM